MMLTIPGLARADRYEVLLRDGTTITGDQLRHLAERRALTLDNQQLLEVDNPLWVLRDTTLSVTRPREYIELVNGDRLIGTAHTVVTGETAWPWGDHLIVTNTLQSGNVRVRLDWLRRIVRSDVNEGQPAGDRFHLRLADGRELTPQSLRWMVSGAKLLTDGGIVEVAFDEMADICWPEQAIVPPLFGAAFLDGQQPKVVRTVTKDGQIFTFPHSMLAPAPERSFRESRQLLATRPPWSLDTIYFDRDAIVWQTYFRDDEMPLSLLPLIAQEHKAAFHHLPWRRNANVHGCILQCENASGELGIGMHSRTRLTFKLPPHASRFTSLVGFDRRVGNGGCVHVRVYVNDNASPAWERKYVRGSDGEQTVGPIDMQNAETLTLEADFAHEGRPAGADPLDICDWVNWLLPTVEVDRRAPSFASRRQEDIARLVPEIDGWQVKDDLLNELTLKPTLMLKDEGWRMALCSGARPLVLEKKTRIDLTNAWLRIEATAADMPGATHEIRVGVESDDVGSTVKGCLKTADWRYLGRVHVLHHHRYEEVTVRVIASAEEGSSRRELKGVVFRPLRLEPLVTGLPPDGKPIEPEVPVTSLEPLSAKCDGQTLSLVPGMVSTRVELNVRGWNFEQGYGVPSGSEITYALDPAWKRFVAIIGMSHWLLPAGQYQILVDNQVIWTSRHDFNRNHQGEQVNVELPKGGRTITLKLLDREHSSGAWAHAGFLTK